MNLLELTKAYLQEIVVARLQNPGLSVNGLGFRAFYTHRNMYGCRFWEIAV